MLEYSKKYIARHVKFISPDVIEIRRPVSPTIRFFIVAFYIVFIIIAFIEYQFRDDISKQDIFDAFFHPAEVTNRKYQEYIEYVTENLEGKTRKENEIKLFQPDYAQTLSFNNGIAFLKTIINTDSDYLLPMMYSEKPRMILLGLPAEKKESIIVRQIGNGGIGEGELMNFIEDFLLSENNDFYSIYSPIKSKYNMLSFTLFPISYHEDKTLERIEKWLNKPSNNEESQNFAKAKAIYYQIEKKVDKALTRKIIIVTIMSGIGSLIQTLRLRGLL
ncbi:hypothetical protein BKK49_04130 [Rodentibacter rarus]|uniref:hypothetical protein n=1 Tax=Rodentibacter rarus TaxID=1908260 RepID=UPI000985EB7E|nr:hypothetical protein [Rodentibacter rarus]OOF41908.1 hypothetical protein BKK49_04130 [Rodentibacter rarus]